MAGNQATGDGLSVNIAGMSKNQLYDIMSQMKVKTQTPLFLSFFFSFQIDDSSFVSRILQELRCMLLLLLSECAEFRLNWILI